MPVEIERKFLVDPSKLPELPKGTKLRQGYMPSAPGNVVRVRTADEKAFLTIKGKTEGYSRLEYEYEIPLSEAHEILDQLCEKPVVAKTRYVMDAGGGRYWELDIFEEGNKGLYLAEIELQDENESFETPDWITREVSHLKQYRNNFLAKNPYSTWESDY